MDDLSEKEGVALVYLLHATASGFVHAQKLESGWVKDIVAKQEQALSLCFSYLLAILLSGLRITSGLVLGASFFDQALLLNYL